MCVCVCVSECLSECVRACLDSDDVNEDLLGAAREVAVDGEPEHRLTFLTLALRVVGCVCVCEREREFERNI